MDRVECAPGDRDLAIVEIDRYGADTDDGADFFLDGRDAMSAAHAADLDDDGARAHAGTISRSDQSRTLHLSGARSGGQPGAIGLWAFSPPSSVKTEPEA